MKYADTALWLRTTECKRAFNLALMETKGRFWYCESDKYDLLVASEWADNTRKFEKRRIKKK